MPTFKGQLSETQIQHLIAYIKSLSVAPTTSEAPDAQPEGEEL